MQDLQDARRKRSAAVDAFDAWSQHAAASALPDIATLTDDEILRLVKAAFQFSPQPSTCSQMNSG